MLATFSLNITFFHLFYPLAFHSNGQWPFISRYVCVFADIVSGQCWCFYWTLNTTLAVHVSSLSVNCFDNAQHSKVCFIFFFLPTTWGHFGELIYFACICQLPSKTDPVWLHSVFTTTMFSIEFALSESQCIFPWMRVCEHSKPSSPAFACCRRPQRSYLEWTTKHCSETNC